MSALGIVLLDHGSRRAEANAQLDELARLIAARYPEAVVRSAHLEICPPTVGDAIAACVEAGASQIVVHPFFLAPGRHVSEDVPRLVTEVAQRYPQIEIVTSPLLGLETGVVDAVTRRIDGALDETR